MSNGLGTLTGNVTEFFAPGRWGKPEPGMGATLVMWTDTYPYTITRVSDSGKSFWMKEDRAIRTDSNGMSECQEYRYEQNPDAPEEMVRMTKNGWICRGMIVRVGYRRKYYDYSF